MSVSGCVDVGQRMSVPEEPHGDTPRKVACRLPSKRVPGASHRNRIPQRRITVGEVWKIVHDVHKGQPTVAEPLIS